MIELSGFKPNAILDVGRARPQISAAPDSWIPTADVYEVDDELVIEIELSGCQNETITTKVVKDEATMRDWQVFFVMVEGQRDPIAHATERFHNERWQGKFARIFRVPTTYDEERVLAGYNDGLLRINIPKKPDDSLQVTNILEQNIPEQLERSNRKRARGASR
jgi:HSP20 family protein